MRFLGSFFKRNKKGISPRAEADHEKSGIIGGKYEVYGELGHGGFGIVYKVYSHESKEVYALKTFKDEYLEDAEVRKLFRKEASVWSDLERHPYLVQAYFVDEISRRLYIAMEYIAPNKNGLNTLDGYLKHQPPDLSQSLRWAIQFCHGMEYAYSKGVRCHRDIKPANIMITVDETVKISDFGLAGVLDASKTASRVKLNAQQSKVGRSASIMDGKGCGTSTHMPPEQFINATDCDQRSDIYAFGVVLYQMASGGKLPFLASLPRDESIEEQARFSREMYRLHCKASVPKVNSPLFPIICCCLEKNKDRRYSTFRELRADLELLLKRETGEIIKPPELKELDALEWLRKGFSLNNLGRFDEAINCYDKALEIDPQGTAAWNNKGASLDSLGRFDEAITCYDKALEYYPQYANAWNNKGISLKRLGRFNEAMNCYDKALEIDPQYAYAWNNKGDSLKRLRRFDEAITCYDKALKINPQNANAWNNKRDLVGHINETIARCNKALELDPKDPNAWLDKGASLYRLGRFNEAITCYDKELKLHPQDTFAWNKKGSSLYRLGRFNEAITCYDKALKINPQNANAWLDKGASLYRLGRFNEAITCYDKALKIDPRYAYAWNNKGNSLNSLGRFNEAIICLDKALEIDPQDQEAWSNKGSLLNSLGRFNEAIICLDKALEIDPQDQEAWSNKGTALNYLGRFDEAMDCCNKALEIDPQDQEAWSNKGTALNYLGRFDEAMDCCNKALEIDPQYTKAYLVKGAILYSLGHSEEAIKCYNKVLKFYPTDAYAWYNKALAEDKLGKKQAAKSYRQLIEWATAQHAQMVQVARQRLRELEEG